MKRRTFLAATSALLSCITKVVYARSGGNATDTLVFKFESVPILNASQIRNVRDQLETLAKEVGHKIVLVTPPVEPYVVGKSTFVAWNTSRPIGKHCSVRCCVTGDEIPRVRWAESSSGLVCHFEGDRSPELVLSHFPGGIEFDWRDSGSA